MAPSKAPKTPHSSSPRSSASRRRRSPVAPTAADGTLTPRNEGIFVNRILTAAREKGWLAYHTHDSRGSAAGFPDLVLVRPPRVVFAECKTDDTVRSKTTTAQDTWLAALAACPAIEQYLWRYQDWSKILEVLK